MPHFTYIARKVDGTVERGSLEAASLEEARERLRKRALVVENLQQSQPGGFAPQVKATPAPSWVTVPEEAPAKVASVAALKEEDEYAPLSDTFRLFAGWLLAWYALVYLLGSYQREYELPYELSFIDNMFSSPLVLRFAFGTFLFLFFGSLHRWMRGGMIKGILFFVLWGLVMAFFVANT